MAPEKTVSWTIEYPQVVSICKMSPFKPLFELAKLSTLVFFFNLTHCSVVNKLCLLFSSSAVYCNFHLHGTETHRNVL